MERIYHTRQREAVLEYMAELNGGHTTAAQIAAHFKTQGISVGRTTVYRHLEQLVNNGMVRRYTLDGTAGACYQLISKQKDCGEHFHLKCEGCGELQHLDCDRLSEAQRHIFEEHTFQINSAKTVFYGLCRRCRGNRPQDF